MNKIAIGLLIIFMTGCSHYKSNLDVEMDGKDIKTVYGLIGDGKITINKQRSFDNQREEKYLSCLEQLNQCVAENKNTDGE